MTVLQNGNSSKMPVGQQGNSSHTQDVLWDEHYFNTKKPPRRKDSSHNNVIYSNESHNNNNNGRPVLDTSEVPRPRRDHSAPRFRGDANRTEGESLHHNRYSSRHHSIPNVGHLNGYTEFQDINNSAFLQSGIDKNYLQFTYVDEPDSWDGPENGTGRLTRSLQFSSAGNDLNKLDNYPAYVGESDEAEGQELNSDSIIPDGYATISRRKRHPEAPLRKSSDSALLRQFNLQSNGLNEPKFLAHSLALSGNGNSREIPQEQQRPSKLNLSHTIHALPQHDIQVRQARMVYLKESEPLANTQPVVSQSSAPGTPLSEDLSYTPSESSTPDLDKRKHGSGSLSQSLNSSLNSSVDIDQKKSSKSPLQTITESFSSILKTRSKGEQEKYPQPRLLRSNSTPNVLEALEDEDVDQDDYGFLNYRSFRSKNHPFKPSSSSAMQKAKTSNMAGDVDGLLGEGQARSLSKKWKKSKVSQSKSAISSAWKPQVGVNCHLCG